MELNLKLHDIAKEGPPMKDLIGQPFVGEFIVFGSWNEDQSDMLGAHLTYDAQESKWIHSSNRSCEWDHDDKIKYWAEWPVIEYKQSFQDKQVEKFKKIKRDIPKSFDYVINKLKQEHCYLVDDEHSRNIIFYLIRQSGTVHSSYTIDTYEHVELYSYNNFKFVIYTMFGQGSETYFYEWEEFKFENSNFVEKINYCFYEIKL